MDVKTPPSEPPPRTTAPRTAVGTAELDAAPRRGVQGGPSRQLGVDGLAVWLLRNLLMPVRTTSIWYMLGGILGIALALEVLTGIPLLFVYNPDAGHAYQSTSYLLKTPGWSTVINFHYYTSYLIFGLVLLHLMRTFISGAYHRAKNALWQLGAALGVLIFSLTLTGEALHWDERGFAIPWHIGELLEALRLQHVFDYVHKNLTNIDFATGKLVQLYALHIAVLPVLLIAVMVLHYRLIKRTGVSRPFRRTASRLTSYASEAWIVWCGVIFGTILVISAAVTRAPGPAAQNLPFSPLHSHNLTGDPGRLGATPSLPISWTHGWNRVVTILFHMEPDIWGTVIAMVLMLGAIVLIPFVDRLRGEPVSWRQALDLRRRGWAFGLMFIFWATMLAGIITDEITPIG